MLKDKVIVVAGGTGNVGGFIVRDLLSRQANVVVPSRSQDKLLALETRLSEDVDTTRLHSIVGDAADPTNNMSLLEEVSARFGEPEATIASLGQFQMTPSLLKASASELNSSLRDYLIAHFEIAKLFLPAFSRNGGTYVFINGPLAFTPWDGTGLVSVSTAAQHMLFRSFAKELTESKANIVEVVNYAFIRDHKTQPSSILESEEIGRCLSWLIDEGSVQTRGESIHLKEPLRLD